MTIPKHKITAYQAYLIAENRAVASIREHIRYAERFAEFAGRRMLSPQLLEEYRKYIDDNYTTSNSKNNCVSYINVLLKFLKYNELKVAYFRTKRTKTVPKVLPLTDDDIANLLQFAKNHNGGGDSN